MRHRIDVINWLPERLLCIRDSTLQGERIFIAEIDGRAVATASTREAAIQALLRRVVQETVH